MIYRTNATGLREAEEQQDAQEIEELRAAARARRRRAAFAISIVVLGGFATFFTVAALSPPQQSLQCHHVQIQWENAPAVPGPGWTTCGWR